MRDPASLAQPLLLWYAASKRDLPWRQTTDPYCIWISEIMLQQTRVETVKGYYERFLRAFPTVAALAAAPQEDVLKAWEGLGYYSRARHLQQAAQRIVHQYEGAFPNRYEALLTLPGIGPYTAGAIASIAFEERVPAIDGNVYRVAARYFGIREDIGSPVTQRLLRNLVINSLPAKRIGDYNQALMELGATLCVPGAPRCQTCPWQPSCDAYQENDAALLPVHIKKAPPKQMDVAVCLLTFHNQILVMQRQQRLLQGLYVFALLEDVTEAQRASQLLEEQGFAIANHSTLGTARHVFTHRVWEMQLFHFALKKPPSPVLLTQLQAQLVSRAKLETLPFPTAMKTAREKAMELLG